MLCVQQAWTYSKGMQEQSTGTIPKGENNITLEDMEEEGSTVRKMWHSATYSHHNTDITDSGGAESVKLQCPKSHTQVS